MAKRSRVIKWIIEFVITVTKKSVVLQALHAYVNCVHFRKMCSLQTSTSASMFNKLRNTLHEKVHGAKISRQKRQAKVETGGVEECETSSASSVEVDQQDPDQFRISTTFAVEVTVRSVVDLASSPAYFYVCVGEEGEATSRKKKRGIHSSRVFYGKSPKLPDCSFLLPINGLANPEITLRFSRSSIVGTDTFLGECRFKVNLKGSLDSLGDEISMRIEGGGSAVVCLGWTLLPFDSKLPLETRRSNILPETHYISEIDKLDGLVDSVRKTLNSLVESKDEEDHSIDSPLKYKIDFLTSIFDCISVSELDYVLLRVSISDLVRLVPNLLENTSFISNLKSGQISVMNLARVIRCLEHDVPQFGEIISRIVFSCNDRVRLEELKFLLNRGGDRFDLLYLVKHVIESKNLRQQILGHFDRFSSKSVKILSEIDQVVYSPFGSVRMWPDGHIPGFKLLMDALSEDVTFVSNRPISSLIDTRKIVREAGMGDAPLLISSAPIPASHGGLVQRLQQSYSACVIDAWKEYRQIFPRCSFIWFGENIEMAKQLMSLEAKASSGARIALAIVMGDEMVEKGGPVLVDHESGRIVACANYVQATMACVDYGYLTVECINRLSMLSGFNKLVDGLAKDYNKVRHKHLLKERIVDMRFDLQRLTAKVQSLVRKAGLRSSMNAVPSISHEEFVDSVILTPIEALSPTLTNHSPSPGPIGIGTGSYDSEIILTGV